MKKRAIVTVAAVLLLTAALWAGGRLLFTQRIDQRIEAAVYRDGEAIGTTTVLMRGKRVQYPWDNSFVGEFRIPWAGKTDIDGLRAQIQWSSENHVQRIRYSYEGELFVPSEYGIVYFLLISDDMREFALMTTQRDVIATSAAAYQLCIGHISTDGGSRAEVTGIDEIPAL